MFNQNKLNIQQIENISNQFAIVIPLKLNFSLSDNYPISFRQSISDSISFAYKIPSLRNFYHICLVGSLFFKLITI